MKPEAGKKYVLKSGQVVGPLWRDEGGVYMSNDFVGGFLPMWKEDGEADFFTKQEDNYPEHSVLAEYVELT